MPSLPVQDELLSRLEAAEAGQGITADLWWVALQRPCGTASAVARRPASAVQTGLCWPIPFKIDCVTLRCSFLTLQLSRCPVRAEAAARAAGSAVPAGAGR